MTSKTLTILLVACAAAKVVEIDLMLAKTSDEHTFYAKEGDTIQFINNANHNIYQLISGDTFGTTNPCDVSYANLVDGIASPELSGESYTVLATDTGRTVYFACIHGSGTACGGGMYASIVYSEATSALGLVLAVIGALGVVFLCFQVSRTPKRKVRGSSAVRQDAGQDEQQLVVLPGQGEQKNVILRQPEDGMLF